MWLLKVANLLWRLSDGSFKHYVLFLEFKHNRMSSFKIKLIRKALNRTVHANSRRVFHWSDFYVADEIIICSLESNILRIAAVLNSS